MLQRRNPLPTSRSNKKFIKDVLNMKNGDAMKTLVDFYNMQEFKNLKLKIGEQVSSDKSLKLSVFSVICNSNLINLLNTKKIEKFNINIKEGKDYWKIKMRRLIERSDIENGKRTVSGIAIIEKPKYHKKIWHIITLENLDFQKNCIERLIDLLRPDVSRFYLTSNEIKSIFSNFEDKGYNILVTKAILYSRKEEGNISFEESPYHEVFYKAEEEDRYVDKINFLLQKNHNIVLYGFISREGLSKFIGGNINFFYDKFLLLLANFGEEKRRKLNKKEKNMQNYDLKPLALKFREEIIREKEENRRIIDSLQKLPRSSMFIYHFNPYLHLSLLDFIDGSSCDIFISAPDEISIIPSYNCTLSSLMRIFSKLSKDFKEGEIIEKKGKKVQFLDFFE